ncbi:IgGFc-binding protein-like [Mixophyes fleayi]|uniref:IgGFc-binding protein-like n=1 Tax=Mixophyes fleayi TaxID=3061075 RepID=UPI003F4DB225
MYLLGSGTSIQVLFESKKWGTKKGVENSNVNNQRQRLPLTLYNGRVNLYQSGTFIYIVTDFYLRVHYDWNSILRIFISSSYFENVCGMCGYFNENPADDLGTPSSSQSSNLVDFAKSWKVEDGDRSCWNTCNGDCKVCPENLRKVYESNTWCGRISDANNSPFRQCHSKVNPKIYVDNCVYDVCLNGGSKQLLCQNLATYASACQRYNIPIYEWRNLSGCPLQCPANSQYKLCGDCPLTCNNAAIPSSSSSSCMETCQCNSGFVLDGGKCIPKGNCGCIFEGKLYALNEKFYGDTKCGKLCTCNSATKTVDCKSYQCRPSEMCSVIGGIQDCYPKSYGTCTASGDPHYTTYDNLNYNFQGTCTYLFSGVCKNAGDLVDFQIYVENENRANNLVAYTSGFKTDVYGLSIMIRRQNPGKIELNGILMNLPFYPDNGKMSIDRQGSNVILQTIFGLRISFNWDSRISVTVPQAYAGALCGLCGTFDGNKKNEFVMKDGSDAGGPIIFGKSWKVKNTLRCSDDDKAKCPKLAEMANVYRASKTGCGMLVDKDGPFRDCHEKIDPEGSFQDCVFDACFYNDREDIVCKIIASYVTSCQAAGKVVNKWRTDTFCSPKCDNNSHYELCATVCSPTCFSLSTPVGCNTLCSEGCFCDDGFILSGDVCVPVNQCGCTYGGVYYKSGEKFFSDDLCKQQCECTESGLVECKSFTCEVNTECKVMDGVRKCYPMGSANCSATGASYYMSFDGQSFQFQGTCTYTLTKTITTNSNLKEFVINAKKEKGLSELVALISLVSAEVYGYILILQYNVNGKIKVNGSFYNLPLTLEGGKIRAFQQGSRVIISTDFGLQVSYDLTSNVVVTVPGNYKGQLGGLCGNYNGIKTDDFKLRNNNLAPDARIFGADWKIPGEVCNDGCGSANDPCKDCDNNQKNSYMSNSYCGFLKNSNSLSSCQKQINPDTYSSCISDLCTGNGDLKILCQYIQSYVAECQAAGITIQPWRNEDCPFRCPPNSHYSICADVCSTSCASINDPVKCPAICSEGCECDDGYLFDGTDCVSIDKCGCFNGGRYYKLQEAILSNDCTNVCTCNPKGVVMCKETSCAKDETCQLVNGVFTCVSKVNPCDSIKCRSRESCQISNKNPICVPISEVYCYAVGDPHYRTFDGKTYNFQGTCTYTIAKTCGKDGGLTKFNIEAKNENRGNTQVSYVSFVNIQVYDFVISLVRYEYGFVRLNNQRQRLPVTLNNGRVKLYQAGIFLTIVTDFTLLVFYDWNSSLYIYISSSYYENVCGMCGYYNENPADDLATPDGPQANNLADFGKSWRVEDGDKLCWHNCNGECKVCPENFRKMYASNTWCGRISESNNGPFRQCHSKIDPQIYVDNCVYDVCLNGGSKQILCQNLATYALFCQGNKIRIEEWRQLTGCPLQCPANSQYKLCGDCPLTCNNAALPSSCSSLCVETCQCNSGFVLDGGKCIPKENCGCIFEGKLYALSEKFYGDTKCEKLCTCNAATKTVDCKSYQCKPNEMCSVISGIQDCYPKSYGTCTASGDPHYTTYDNLNYNFQGTCTYLFSGVCKNAGDLVDFQIYVENENRANKLVAYTSGFKTDVYGLSIIIRRQNPGKIELNGILTNLPFYPDNGKMSIDRQGSNIILQTIFGLRISFNWDSRISVTVPQAYAGALCGLCGTFDGNKKNEFVMKDGSDAGGPAIFGKSWKVKDTPGCSDDDKANCPKLAEMANVYRASKMGCGMLVDKDGPFRDCHQNIDPEGSFQDCVFDACFYNDREDIVCKIIASYVTSCQAAGKVVNKWRTDTFCSPKCDNSSHYELCATGCSPTCFSLSPPVGCNTLCSEGCFCDDGFIRSGDGCVPVNQCGCTYGGVYYKSGEKFFSDDLCKQQCECTESGQIECKSFTCEVNTECKVMDGVRKCYPMGSANCSATGASYYMSFDGQSFQFQGTCTYTLTKTITTNSNLKEFVINAKKEKGLSEWVALISLVSVEVYGYILILQYNVNGKIKVNGSFYNLPLTLEGGKIRAYQQGSRVIISTDFGLQVSYDLTSNVVVTVPGNYKGQLGGLCGNYNGIKTDDFKLRNNNLAPDARTFGADWKIPGEDSFRCPPNSHYSICADVCSTSCASINDPVKCPAICSEGCECDDGYLFDGTDCVSIDKCGCFNGGRYYKLQEAILSNDCTNVCTCNPKGVVTCKETSCAKDETCQLVNGVFTCVSKVNPCDSIKCRSRESCQISNKNPICVPRSEVYCYAVGDPHYRTFDGKTYNFQGTCTYTIAKTCGKDGGLTKFNIEAKNENRGNTQVSYVSFVNIQVYDFVISLVRYEYGFVRLNNQRQRLPVTLNNGRVKLYQAGIFLTIVTDFTLLVFYDWNSSLYIYISSSYYENVCGMCGYYNENPADDLATPAGPQENNLADFGKSWRVEDGDKLCWHNCNGECKVCPENLRKMYASNTWCGRISESNNGPFRQCHSKIDPQIYVDNCVYDVCLNGGSKQILCQNLATYALFCQGNKIRIEEWRQLTGCPMQCPANSQYKLCGDCPLTCNNAALPSSCSSLCVENCQCNSGFVLDGGKCIPKENCGCIFEGKLYALNEKFYGDTKCEKLCTCNAATKTVDCKSYQCKPSEICSVISGIQDCYPKSYGTCTASGDPHYTTYDNLNYNFQGTCIYLFSGVCKNAGDLVDFQIYVENENRANKLVAYTSGFKTDVYGLSINIRRQNPGKIELNGVLMNLPFYPDNGKMSIDRQGSNVILQTIFGLRISFNWDSRISVTVPQAYAGALCGLCGTFDGNKKNEFVMKDGSEAGGPAIFGKSWKVKDTPGCSDDDKANCPKLAEMANVYRAIKTGCGMLVDKDGPFRDCHQNIDPEGSFQDCVFDACFYNDREDIVCKIIASYVTSCQAAGNVVNKWRTDTFCSPKCDNSSHYELCATGCSPTCFSLSPPVGCNTLCSEGCFCDDGFIRSGDGCVPVNQCGCTYGGVYYKSGEIFFSDELCKQQCECTESGQVECKSFTCEVNTECNVLEGVRKCYPMGSATCSAVGASYYMSFDRQSFQFQGTCTYTLTKTIITNSNLEQFVINVKKGKGLSELVALINLVSIEVYGYILILQYNVNGKIKVNGPFYNLPLTLEGGKIRAYQQGSRVIVSTDFGLQVSYDLTSNVVVTVPGNYKGQLGGLCGNYNGIKTDDFKLRNNNLAPDARTFGADWKIPGETSFRCPPNSHYSICADVCSTSCASINDPVKCPANCSEGCECDDGYLFDGTNCVSIDKCGCFEDGRYYKPKETILSNDCKKDCTCNSKGVLTCKETSCVTDETCQLIYDVLTCANKDPCKSIKCKTQETCKIKDGNSVCVPNFYGTCWLWGDPHYVTFDQYSYDFQGTCTYILASYTGDDDSLVRFKVEDKNGNRGNTVVSYVRTVSIYVYGYKMSIVKDEYGKIRVNDIITSLPVTLLSGKISASISGVFAVISTDFGLQVSYEYNWYATVTLPSSYYGLTGGLCGNFNRNDKDEKITVDNRPVNSIAEWATSWKVKDDDPLCFDSNVINFPNCDNSQKSQYKDDKQCGLISKINGPFRECYSQVDSQTFLENCLYDVCINGGAKQFLCQALSAYASICRKRGIKIYDWRTPSGCSLPCPENSHYESCGNPCPITCTNPTAPSQCSDNCVETCQCNDKFFLSGDKCVPVESCGCLFTGVYYKPDETFWYDSKCTVLCKCDSSLRIVVCNENRCKAEEQCAIVNGIRGCQPLRYSTCSSTGDPHYTTFDGKRFDFMGTCLYQMVGVTSEDRSLPKFTVKVQNNNRGNKAVSHTKVVIVEVYNLVLTLSRDYPRRILINGIVSSLPFFYQGNKVVAYISGNIGVIKTIFGVTVTFDWNSNMAVTVPSSYSNGVTGLCGNYNKDPNDDLMVNGKLTSADQFGDSWKVADLPGCSAKCTKNCMECLPAQMQNYVGENYCGQLKNRNGPFSQCLLVVNPDPFFEDCTFDACFYQGHPSSFCSSISNYVHACQAVGVKLQEWRSNNFCPPSCPPNSHYALCENACPVTCRDLSSPTGCNSPCKEGCYCDSGFILSGDKCVPIAQCGCVHLDRYYQKDEIFFPNALCIQKCQCGDDGNVNCKNEPCNPTEECKVSNGVLGCFAREYAQCVATGDPHFITFDGRSYDFQGTCTYIFAKTVVNDPGLVSFSVMVANNRYKNLEVSLTRLVVVSVYNYLVAIEQGMMWRVKVNGEVNYLPLTLLNGRISVNQEGSNIMLQTDFGLTVLYDTIYHVILKVPGTYSGKIGGLCGNFNKDPKDDFQLPDTTVVSDADEFGAAWKVDVAGVDCSDGCKKNCPDLKDVDLSPYKNSNNCGMMTDTDGPFKECHSMVKPSNYFDFCTYDAAVLKGEDNILCKSLQAYTAACHNAGINVKQWRTSTFCPMTCPENSHYELCTRTCDNTCYTLSAEARCSERCFEGCECDIGFLFDEGACVKMNKCGCVFEGRYLGEGESYVNVDCSQKFKCQFGGVICISVSCKSNEVCILRYGVRNCNKKEADCLLDSKFETFDGISGAPVPSGPFVLATLCINKDKAWFRVLADVQGCGTNTQSVNRLHIFLVNAIVTISKEASVWVNGWLTSLPVTLSDMLSASDHSGNIIVQIGQYMRAELSRDGLLKLSVSNLIPGDLCGACGNFNSLGEDDLLMPNGKQASDITQLITSWKGIDLSSW